MGHMIWNEWGRLVAMCSGLYTAWAGLWGIFYRKYFWDFVGGEMGPVGIIPPIEAKIFIDLIVKIPAIQVACIVFGVLTLAIEWPLFPRSFFYRSITFKMIVYIIAAGLSALVYQCFDAAIFYFVAIFAYAKAASNAEEIGANDEKGGGARGKRIGEV